MRKAKVVSGAEGKESPSLDAIIKEGIEYAQMIIENQIPDLPKVIPFYDRNGNKHTIRSCNLIEGFFFEERRIWLPDKLAATCFYHYLQTCSPVTAASYAKNLVRQGGVSRLLVAALGMPVKDAYLIWVSRIFPTISSRSQGAAYKAILRFYASRGFGDWRRTDDVVIRTWPNIRQDKYKAIRSTETFIPAEDQARIVAHLDLCASKSETLTHNELIDAALIAVHWQQGLRPIQASLMRVQDCRFYGDDHCRIRYHWAKQRNNRTRETIRRMRPEWSPIFQRLCKASTEKFGNDAALFTCSPSQISGRLRSSLKRVCSTSWSANNLRHSAAQRHADAGRTQEEIAAFLCHSDPRSSLFYIKNAASEGERINKALGLSPTYSKIHIIAKIKTIDTRSLFVRPEQEQIGAVVHGIPIAGIGSCNAGQPSCALNPVLSCYTCPKFLPVHDKSIHKNVASSLRAVVNKFYVASRSEAGNPTFAQLKATIESAEQIALSIESELEN